jgi:predicted DNA-binding protein
MRPKRKSVEFALQYAGSNVAHKTAPRTIDELNRPSDIYDTLSDNERRENEMESQRISVRVPGKTVKRLRERARATGKRESDVVRLALEEHLSKAAETLTAYDRFLRAGLIGCAVGAPKDIATNKKYFEGFGKSK